MGKLRQADVALGKGLKVPQVCRQLGISEQTYYRWRQKYGGMAPEMAKHLKALEKENARLKRVHRLWKQEHLQVPRRQRKRRRLPGTSENGCIRHRATHRNHVWSYDFLMDRTEDGRQLKVLVVLDEFTRECLASEVGRTFTARDVMLTLEYLFAVRGAPEHVRSDNGPEFVAKEIQRWLARACVGTLYIQKASPW